VQKEKVRLESEPLTEGDRGSEIVEGETEVTLSEERPVVGKETVAKEKVGLVKEVEEEQRTVTEDVRKEQIEAEGDIRR
jgi:stress response protein YsnF